MGGKDIYDWNQNGKYDLQDSMLDYELSNSHVSSEAYSDWWKWFLLAIVVGVCLPIRIVIAIITLLVG